MEPAGNPFDEIGWFSEKAVGLAVRRPNFQLVVGLQQIISPVWVPDAFIEKRGVWECWVICNQRAFQNVANLSGLGSQVHLGFRCAQLALFAGTPTPPAPNNPGGFLCGHWRNGDTVLGKARAELSPTVLSVHSAPAKAGGVAKLDTLGAGTYAPLLGGPTAKSHGDLGNRRG